MPTEVVSLQRWCIEGDIIHAYLIAGEGISHNGGNGLGPDPLHILLMGGLTLLPAGAVMRRWYAG